MQNWPYPVICAHRGGGVFAPENTLAGLRCGVAHGFKGVEFDVMLSRDDVPVLMHDPKLGRTVRGTGAVPDYTAAQLHAMDAGAWHSPAHTGERVPLFADVLDYGKQVGLWMNVEIKPVPGFEERTGTIAAQMTAQHYADWLAAPEQHRAQIPLLSSFSFVALQAAQAAAPQLPRGMLYEQIPADWQAQLQQLGCVSLHCNHKHLTPEMTQAIRAAGYWVFVYTVNEAARARELLGWGVNGMVTDRLDLLPPDFS
ncbi:MAG: glycerophosphodiester phosphodiesterase [Burkholderiaceae bacterium]|nr:MAG: glycerophosphodiester phosphodiesterase [Burkholderiaceae bacterium]